jgi:hypothetical protein
MVTKKMCDTNKNVTKMVVIIKGVYCTFYDTINALKIQQMQIKEFKIWVTFFKNWKKSD